MPQLLKSLAIILALGLGSVIPLDLAIPGLNDVASETALAQSKQNSAAKKNTRERIINREARQRKGDRKSKIDFEETELTGERKDPLGSIVQQNQSDKNYDLIKKRFEWHKEMVQSASSLESGRMR